MDYSIFDFLLDSVFVVDGNREIEYCNEVAATLCRSSVRRLTRGRKLYEVISVGDNELFMAAGGTKGRDSAVPFQEVSYEIIGKEDVGKIQIAIQPFSSEKGERWVILVRDVTLEEVLHGKYRRELEGKEQLIIELQDAHKKLESYSKGLEVMVEERTSELNTLNRTLHAVLDSLGQGFVVFNEAGICGDVYTKICDQILETVPAGKPLSDVLNLQGKELSSIETWMKGLFSEALPFESMSELGPERFQHSLGRHICLKYHALRDSEENISDVVMVATDKTEEILANQALEREKVRAKMILKIVTAKVPFLDFYKEVPESLSSLREDYIFQIGKFDHDRAYRVLHSLEGMAATFSMEDMVVALRSAQETLEPLRSKESAAGQETLKDYQKALDQLHDSYQSFQKNNVDILNLVDSRGKQKKEISEDSVERALGRLRSRKDLKDLYVAVEEDLLKQSLIDGVTSQKMTLTSVIESLGKEIYPIELEDGGCKVFCELYRGFFTSLVHMYRNIADHGIEDPSERAMMGKPRKGLVKISTSMFQRSSEKWFKVEISDDGNGIDVERLRDKLMLRDGEQKWQGVSTEGILQQIFMPGFSSSDTVSTFSGRGVGMDAVNVELAKLGGTITVESTLGVGTIFTINIPDLGMDYRLNKAA